MSWKRTFLIFLIDSFSKIGISVLWLIYRKAIKLADLNAINSKCLVYVCHFPLILEDKDGK